MTAKSRNPKYKPQVKCLPGKRSIRKHWDPTDFNKREASWAVGNIDRAGQWGWESISKDELWDEIVDKLKSFESMTWTSIMEAGSHNIEKDRLIRPAKKRLEELELDDLDELFSLRLTGKKRIWGILDKGVLAILWYDPKHQICPSEKKYT